MAPGGRTNFSPEDDAHLVEYLAEYNQGRKGNKLYHQLVDNPDQFPWAKRHTWQAWRHRYMRDTDDLDRRIHVQQKRNLITLFEDTQNEASTSRNSPPAQESPAHSTVGSPRLHKRKATPTNQSNIQEKRPRVDVSYRDRPCKDHDSEEDFEAEDLSRRVRLSEGPSCVHPKTLHKIKESNHKDNPHSVHQRSSSTFNPPKGPNNMKKDDSSLYRQRDPCESGIRLRKDCRIERISEWAIAEDEVDDEEGDAVGHILLSPSNTSMPKGADLLPDTGLIELTSHKPSLTSTSSTTFTASSSNRKQSASSSSTSQPTWLSANDQSRLIDTTVKRLSDRYDFPPEYVLRVWKETGDLEEAESILKVLGNVANGMLRKYSSRRPSPNSGTSNGSMGNREYKEVPVTSTPTAAGVRAQQYTSSGSDTSAVRNPSRLRESFSVNSLQTHPTQTIPSLLFSGINLHDSTDASSNGTPATNQATNIVSQARDNTPPPPSEPTSSTTGHLLTLTETEPPEISDADVLWPPKLQKVYSAISSPDSKRVLREFWNSYGEDFVQVESTLNENLQVGLIS
ncbi:hypothetical protein J3R30DRAFT_3699241 [Lentinula aciculospora]|uniref:TERF2-interacting telomeric protein 1 Myb domain-containing protein n=1 Tax=Lentinula aciculospora TaxID=153920 RepID=A0A9W9AHE5_9AGAR|nr:hypothetical protein J3R30DRAFT_3699241 [Lentinula aciculospora]